METILADVGSFLPEALRFLNVGWWIVHVVAISGVFIAGYAVGKKSASGKAG